MSANILDSLFWSAPRSTDSDFTAEDPLALDYLGQQVGNWLFGGFTTRTSRAQYYAVVLYGLHLADRAVHAYGLPGDDAHRTRLFERWERFWAMSVLEANEGPLPRGHEDTIRGIRGASRAWFEGKRALPLDYPLISRQSELGSLGAYLSSLRKHGLVVPGTLRPATISAPIIEAFWHEPGTKRTIPLYEKYALAALNPKVATVPRAQGRITLAKVGKLSSLSALQRRGRTQQQGRLWHALFEREVDESTRPLADQLVTIAEEGVDDTTEILEGILQGRWGALPDVVLEKVRAAELFGRFSVELLGRFDRAYEYVLENNLNADYASAAEAAFPKNSLGPLRELCGQLLAASGALRFRKLAFHGPQLMRLANELVGASPKASLERVLNYHRAVQRSRRGGGSWMRVEGEKITLQLLHYNGYKATAIPFPGFKLWVVHNLLRDLGRLS